MKEQLDLLWELQKIDLELKSIKEERERYPKEMKRLDEKQKIEKEKDSEGEEKRSNPWKRSGGRKKGISAWSKKRSSGRKEDV